MEKHEDFNVGCPKCESTIFRTTKFVVHRSIYERRPDKSFIHRLPLTECKGCDTFLLLLESELVVVEEEVANANKSPS